MKKYDELLPLFNKCMEIINDTYLKLPQIANEEMFHEAMDNLIEICDGMIDFKTYEGASLFADYYAFCYLTDGESLIEKYFEQLVIPDTSVEKKIIKALSHSYVSVFFITEVIEGIGFKVTDTLYDTEDRLIIAPGFSKKAEKEMSFVARIADFHDFSLFTGMIILLSDGGSAAAKNYVLDIYESLGIDDLNDLSKEEKAEFEANLAFAAIDGNRFDSDEATGEGEESIDFE